jgi:hypothetical protein
LAGVFWPSEGKKSYADREAGRHEVAISFKINVSSWILLGRIEPVAVRKHGQKTVENFGITPATARTGWGILAFIGKK